MLSEAKLRLSAERLREMLHYAPETGLFYWRKRRGNMAAGSEAGGLHTGGYRVIRVDGARHAAHRLAWLYVHGEHPAREIDHRNGNPADNRIANLRQCSHAQNTRNVAGRGNRSGFKGVYRQRSKWRAEITVNGRRVYIGAFSTPQKAADAYDAAARVYHGEFARTNAQMAAERIEQSTAVRQQPKARPQLALWRPLRLDAQPRSGAVKALFLRTTSPLQDGRIWREVPGFHCPAEPDLPTTRKRNTREARSPPTWPSMREWLNQNATWVNRDAAEPRTSAQRADCIEPEAVKSFADGRRASSEIGSEEL